MPPIRVTIDCPLFASRPLIDRVGLTLVDDPAEAEVAVVSAERLERFLVALDERGGSPRPLLLAVDGRRHDGAAMRCIAAGADDYAAVEDGEERLFERLLAIERRARRRRADELELTTREHHELLQGVMDAIVTLLSSERVSDSIDAAFERLGRAAGVDRVYLAMHGHDATGWPTIRVSHEWHGADVPPLPPHGLFDARPVAPGSRAVLARFDEGRTLSILVDELPADVQERLAASGARSMLAVPILRGGRAIAHVGFVDCHAPRRWKSESSAVLETTAAAVGEVFLRDAATGALARHAARLRALYEASDPTLDVQAQLDATLGMAAQAFDADVAVITRVDPTNPERGEIEAAVPHHDLLHTGARIPITERHHAVIEGGEPVVMEDLPEDAPARAEYGIRAISIVPLHVEGTIWGTLGLLSRRPRPEAPTEAERRALSLLGRFVTLLLTRRAADAKREALERRIRESQRLESLGVLAGGVAHDFNNLLMAILGNAELTLLDVPEGARARENVRQITLAAQRAAELTQQMLAYAGKARLRAEAVRLDRLVGEMSELLAVVLPPDAKLRVDADEGVPPIAADSAQLRQIVMNLITNAGDALGGAEGTITVRVTQAVLADAPAGLGAGAEPGQYVVLEVSDTGRGMSDAVLSRAFDPFFTTKDHGRGLGLAVVGGLVRAHGAVLQVDSAPGEGTTFRVLFRARDGALEAETREADAAPANGLAGRHMLVVDDAPMVRDTVRRLLEREGARVTVAEDGDAALRRMRAGERFDGVVLDLTMPGPSGLEVLAELRKVCPKLPVVIMSGYSEEAVEERERAEARFLQKPFGPEQLVRAVASALSER